MLARTIYYTIEPPKLFNDRHQRILLKHKLDSTNPTQRDWQLNITQKQCDNYHAVRQPNIHGPKFHLAGHLCKSSSGPT